MNRKKYKRRGCIEKYIKTLFITNNTRSLLNRSISENVELISDFIANAAKRGKFVLFGAGRFRRVVKAPMNTRRSTRKYRAIFFSVIADRYHVIEFLPCKFIHRF